MGGDTRGELQAPRQLDHDSEMPPAVMRMRLDNTTDATVIVEIRDVNSELGNFAVRPDQVTLNKGKSVEVEPMTSLLGVETFSLPVHITLRSGGETESKVITLHIIPPGPANSSSPPPPAH